MWYTLLTVYSCSLTVIRSNNERPHRGRKRGGTVLIMHAHTLHSHLFAYSLSALLHTLSQKSVTVWPAPALAEVRRPNGAAQATTPHPLIGDCSNLTS